MVLESTVAVKPNYSIPSRVARSLDKKEQVNMLILDFSKAFDTVHISVCSTRWSIME